MKDRARVRRRSPRPECEHGTKQSEKLGSEPCSNSEGRCRLTTPQTTYEAIVVGTDGSDRAAIAVRQALSLAKMTGAKVHVVHAYHTGGGPTSFPHDYEGRLTTDRMFEEANHIREQVLAEAERAGVTAEVHDVSEDPADGIINVATTVGADLVVVGNRGMTGAKRLVLGSVPNAIAHKCPCSVLIVSTDRALSV